MDNSLKGNIGELKAAMFFMEHGYTVFTEMVCDNSPIDLIIVKGDNMLRIQCKATHPYGKTTDVLRVDTIRKSSRYGYSKKYEPGDMDYVTIYDTDSDQLYIVDADEFLRVQEFRLRLVAPKNGQKKGVTLAADYLAEDVIKDMGV